MTDTLPTVWDAEPHTLVKHQILERYLQAWLPILTRQAGLLRQQFGNLASREILFVDGFAGPGEYRGGEPGSPVIALKAALNHGQFPMPVQFLFIEHREDRYERLKQVLRPYEERVNQSENIAKVKGRCGDCDLVLNDLLDESDKKQTKFGPALAFLDQFGYGAVSMDLIGRILSFPQCEVFTYLCYKEMNRFITDPHKADALTRAFGGQEWRECIDLPTQKRRDGLLERYKQGLRERANAKYVVSFLMYDKNNLPLYWLLFCTNNLRGLEEMKEAMWHVDKSGDFRFSDHEAAGQLLLLNQSFDQQWLAGEMMRRLSGKTMTVADIKEWVLVETPCYLFKEALRRLESDESVAVVKAPNGRRPSTYLDDLMGDIVLRFEQKRLF